MCVCLCLWVRVYMHTYVHKRKMPVSYNSISSFSHFSPWITVHDKVIVTKCKHVWRSRTENEQLVAPCERDVCLPVKLVRVNMYFCASCVCVLCNVNALCRQIH